MECQTCLPLSTLVKVDVTVQDVIEQNEFNCIAILTSELNGAVGGGASVINTTDMVKDYVSFTDVATDWDSSTDVYNAAQHAFAQTPRASIVKAMYFDPAGDIPAQLDELFKCESCQGIVIPEIHDDPNVVLAVADWVESKNGDHFYFTDSNDPLTLDSNDATSIAALVQAAGYEYTSVYYHSDPTEEFAVSALSFGLGQDLDLVGSDFTMAFNSLNLVAADFITESQLTAITGHIPASGCSEEFGKYANVYTCVGGEDMMLYGAMGDGNFFDTVLLRQYIKERIQEALSQVFVNGSVPYTAAGAIRLTNVVSFVLQNFQDNGLIQNFVTQVPDVSRATTAQKKCRVLDCPTFSAVLSNRVHSTCVLGELTF